MPDEDEPSGGIIRVLGWELPLRAIPRWAKNSFLVVALVASCLAVWLRYGTQLWRAQEEVHLSKLEAAQLIESRRHFWESPEDEFEIDGGRGRVRHYASDHCSVVVWTMADGSQRPVFALHPRRESEMDVDRELELLLPAPPAQAGVFASPCPGPGPGCCLDPHPPPWEEKAERLDYCTARVWRRFVDGCLHYQETDGCEGVWGPVIWVECYH